ncbi:serine--tRNA ligase [Anaerolineales bacterium HSG6]|nr:serine--tRNA ligase [Anaerolineales bacterium HSG6]MDM8532556.1 serine--tRNA ligase [Anaerolineales bacterium HSG25]
MIDLNFIRQNPDKVKTTLLDLNITAPIDEILDLDQKRRELLKKVEELRRERNSGSKVIGQLMREGKKEEANAQKQRMTDIGEEIKGYDETLRQIEADLTDKQLYVPNMPTEGVPVGPDEHHNVEIRRWGDLPKFDFAPQPHWDLATNLDIIDFERGVKISGSRFYLFKGLGASLHRALVNWFLDTAINEHGYTEIYPPFMVREKAMVGAAHLPKFRDNMYYDTEDDYWFIGTAEVPLSNIFGDEIFDAEQLPIKYVAHTPCFRREKMSAGRDVRGIKRVHQFEKVEMYHYTLPEDSYDHLEMIVGNAENLCKKLGLPYRVIEICTGDLGFAAAKKYDVEVLVPGENGEGEWMEVSSCSNVEAFQARRANLKFRRERGAKPEYLHTLNGSGLPSGRILIAVLENYQQADGSIVIPEVLRPYMGGREIIK